MSDPEVAQYLPSEEQLSGKPLERDFFFGVLCTLRKQYMADIIEEAHKRRFKPSEERKERWHPNLRELVQRALKASLLFK